MASPGDTRNFETNSSSSRNSMNYEFAANAESQNGSTEEPNPEEAQRGRDRQQGQGCSSICMTAIQGIVEKPMPKEKGEAAASAKPSTRELLNPEGRPARASIFPASQKSKAPTAEVEEEMEKLVVGISRLGDREVMGDPREQPRSGQRDVFFEEHSLLLKLLEKHDSPTEIQKRKERNLVTEYPYSGRGWSAVDERAAVTFSQAKPVSQGLLSVSKPPSFTTNQVTYQPQLYGGPWHDYASSCTSSPMPSLYPSMGSNAFLARNSSQSCASYASDSTLYSHSWPTPLETPQGGQSQSSRSFYFKSLGPEMKEKRMPFQEIPSCPWRQHASLSLPQVPWAASSEEGFIDSHCHLDLLFYRLSFKGAFSKFREIYSSSFPKEFQGCISNFCDPRWLINSGLWEELLKEDMVWGTFGCHPNYAHHYNSLERNILQGLHHPKAVAFGKIGLNYSHKSTTSVSQQQRMLVKQLQLAVSLKKPLLIYCREADKDLLYFLKTYVPPDYKIHWQCFIGNYATIEPFLKYFPNLFVGFTGVLTYVSAGDIREALKEIPLERILVESDAPYFVPLGVPKSLGPHSHPGMAIYTVAEIARVKGETLSHTLATLRRNTYRIYNV
ncbi:hypothetical protein MC885_011607 [Smutsia gigantea]|nr:hypothetical protein MC885_011607 [Smutsia gigantea]